MPRHPAAFLAEPCWPDGTLRAIIGRWIANVSDRRPRLMELSCSCSSDRDVDLVVLNRADPLLLRQVTEQGSLLYGDPSRWQEFLAYALKRYQDHRRFLEMEREYVLRATATARR